MPPKGYRAALNADRRQREEMLRQPDSWFAITGLYWLTEGENTIGSDPQSAIVLPARADAYVGSFLYDGKTVRLKGAPSISLTVNGKPLRRTRQIKADMSGAPDEVALSDIRLSVIEREARMGVRVYDAENPALKQFRGLRWYPITPRYRIEARFIPYESPKRLPIYTVIGDLTESLSPGYIEFELDGHTCQLHPESEAPEVYLFFNFRDATNGDTTYGAGRFLRTEGVKGNRVVLDFNEATTPPCAYTPFATCPIAPPQNQLPVRIEAGEQDYPHVGNSHG